MPERNLNYFPPMPMCPMYGPVPMINPNFMAMAGMAEDMRQLPPEQFPQQQYPQQFPIQQYPQQPFPLQQFPTQQLPTPPQVFPPTPTTIAPPDFEIEPGAPVETDILYTQGYLRTQIGKNVKIEFLIGTNMLIDREGLLVDVGISYVIIREANTDDLLLCDIYSIKFVRIYG